MGRSINLARYVTSVLLDSSWAHCRRSPKQVAEVLYDELKLLQSKRGSRSTGEKELTSVINDHDFPVLVLSASMSPAVKCRIDRAAEHRRLNKLLTSYVSSFLRITTRESVIHTIVWRLAWSAHRGIPVLSDRVVGIFHVHWAFDIVPAKFTEFASLQYECFLYG